MRKALTLLAACATAICCIALYLHPILIKAIVGDARIVSEKIDGELYVDGKLEPTAQIFHSNSSFDESQQRDDIIMYTRHIKDFKYPILVVDRKNRAVLIPNSSSSDYDVILGKLFQSDSGANVMVDLKNETKGIGFDPKLKIGEDSIAFLFFDGEKTLEIKLDYINHDSKK